MDERYDLPSPRRLTNAAIIGIVVLLVALLYTVMPLLMSRRPHPHDSGCPANMRVIGRALKMYLADWGETYPTNRAFTANHNLGPVSSYVRLSDVGTDKATGRAIKFQNGINWVEGLYNYIAPIAARNEFSVWTCPDSSSSARSASAEVSYAFNRNLIEQPEKVIQSGSVMMMVSEVDGLLDAELRPTNKSNKNPKAAPQNTFCNAEIHGKGSHILFADGHVKLFDAEQWFSKGCIWDAETKSWFDSSPDRPSSKMIQITP